MTFGRQYLKLLLKLSGGFWLEKVPPASLPISVFLIRQVILALLVLPRVMLLIFPLIIPKVLAI